jgi:DNA-binding NtrC family response regulator
MDLAQGCLERHAGPGRPCRMSAAALEAFLTYEWPGNVRELERVIERAITLAEGDEIQLSDLPPALNERYAIVQPATEGGESMRAWGSRYARLVLERCDNNKRKACRVLDISYHTLQAYLLYQPKLRTTQRALSAAPEAGLESDGVAPPPQASAGGLHTAAAIEVGPALPVIEASLAGE